MNTDIFEQTKHKIWNPIPRKLLKTEDKDSHIRAVVVKENDGSPSSQENTKFSLKSFDPTNSAFKYILAGSTKLAPPKLSVSRSSLSDISALTADTASSEKNSQSEMTSSFQRTLQKLSLNIHHELFTKQANQIETPNFRMNMNSSKENPTVSAKSLQSFFQSLLTQDYPKLFNNPSNNESACATPQEEKEDNKHSCGKHGNVEISKGKVSQFLRPDPSKKKTRHCNCKNSKCLKLYCECLAYGEYCDDLCNCCDCSNNVQKEEARAYALSLIIEKRPEILEGEGLKKQKSSKMVRGKGCNCKKSACLKKYCECFNAGGGCGPNCRCEGCKNPFATTDPSEPLQLHSELGSPMMPKIMKELDLNLKCKAASEKPSMEIGSQPLKSRKMSKNIRLFGGDARNNNSNSPLPVFSSLSFESLL